MDRHIAIYLRVSSRVQSTRSQEPDLTQWAAAYANGSVRWYTDQATGKNMNRPGWQKLERDLDAGRIKQIVVWRLDRLGRTASGLTALFDKLTRLGVGLVSIRDAIDLSTASGRLVANVLASVAAFETELRGERVAAGQAAARAAGKRWGGSKKGRRIRVKPEHLDAIRLMRDAGRTKVEMSRALRLGRQTVYRLLAELDAQDAR